MVAIIVWIITILPGIAQLPPLINTDAAQTLPTGVERRGSLEVTGIVIDGQELLKIASPAVFNRSQPGNLIPVEIRAQQIEANLRQLIRDSDREMVDPKTLEILVETLNRLPVLLIQNAAMVEPRVLLTVTEADAQYHSMSKTRLAEQWQEILQKELQQALLLRQPEAFKAQLSTLINVLITTILVTIILYEARIFYKRRIQQLEKRKGTETTNKTESKYPLLQGLQDSLGLERRLQIARLLQWLMFWAIAFVWILGIAYSLKIFPQTRHFANRVIIIPTVILMTWFISGLINRVSDVAIDRFIQSREEDQSLTEANLQRIATIANAIKNFKMAVIYAIAILWVLQWLKLVTGSILALGALVALAFSFAAQSLLKDFLNGFLILLEDQFRIEDYVKIGTASGMVENLNLRITQIRTDEGNLITLPNSLITQVENMTRTWARTDFRVEVAYNTDVNLALTVVRETVDNLTKDPEWEFWIYDTQELFGVDKISHSGIVIRIWIKTAPLKQWIIARELRRRLKIAFDLHNIQIGIPQQVLLKDDSFGKERSDR
ncbi:small-conductance mechanosensitive channel [Gloeocapsa sp. PCC 73106]|nr:small-conductance mechanosensitive channel [Gloeocapsa sp. PCC 73106]